MSYIETDAELIANLEHLLRGRVREAFIYGSLESDAFGEEEVIDLVLVVHSNEVLEIRHSNFADLDDLGVKLETVIYNPEEFKKLFIDNSNWKAKISQMRKII